MEKISSELKLSELKQNSLSKAYENVHAQASSILLLTLQWRDLEEHFDSTRKSIETRFNELKERTKEMVSTELQLDSMQKVLSDCGTELCEKESELAKVVEKLHSKEEQLDSVQKSVQEYSRDLEVRKQDLNSMQTNVRKCFSALEYKRQQLGSLEKSLEECSNKLRSKEQQLEMLDNSIGKCSEKAMLKEEELQSATKRLEDCAEQFELKQKELCEVQKLIEEQSMELGLNNKHVDSIKRLIQEYNEELELKEKLYDEIGKSIRQRTMKLALKEKEVESAEKSIKEGLEVVKSREEMLMKIKDLSKEIESMGKQLDSMKGVFKKYCADTELKKREYNALGRSLEEHKQELELKESDLKSTQDFIKEYEKQLKSKEEQLNSIQETITECSKEQKSKEQQLDSLEKYIKECVDDLESKRQLNLVEETANARLKELELEEKHLLTFKKSIEERAHYIEMRERQVEERVRELESKEKQLDIIRKSVNEAITEKELERQTNPLPAQVKIEQPENTLVSNAIVPSPAPFESHTAMDGWSLQLLMNKHLHRHELVCGKVSDILQNSSDPPKLVLDAMHGFYPPHSREGYPGSDENILRRSCIFLLEQLMKASPVVKPQVREEAMKLAVEWKAKMTVDSDNYLEVLGFLQLLAAYRLGSDFDGGELGRLLCIVDQHRQKILKSCLWIVLHTCPGTSILHSRIKLEQPELSAKNATAASANLQLSATTYGSLQSLLYEQWNRPDLMGYEILSSLQMSLDPAKLVLDVLQGSIPHIWEKGDIGLETSLMNGYILMLEQLMKVSPWIDPQVKEEATKLAVEWKVKLTAGTKDSLEVLAFLQLLATYRLVSCFNQEEILELFEVVAHYKQALVLCQSLDFADKIHGPVLLLKEHLENARRSTERSCKRKRSLEAKLPGLESISIIDVKMDIDWKSTCLQDKATDNELGLYELPWVALHYNLESQVPPMGIEIRIAELEKLKAERRRSLSALGFTVEPNDPNGGNESSKCSGKMKTNVLDLLYLLSDPMTRQLALLPCHLTLPLGIVEQVTLSMEGLGVLVLLAAPRTLPLGSVEQVMFSMEGLGVLLLLATAPRTLPLGSMEQEIFSMEGLAVSFAGLSCHE
ncbi:FRIGIDA-like protein 5 [Morella rubra]|uniref:FRIGIDA-like protein 5 n=1 Tax=Morella rubra TaxID=262757 RepID=A0A6A1URC9_9ROSI|nr:FRIGIDA-like protein 5 [Morella rubra]